MTVPRGSVHRSPPGHGDLKLFRSSLWFILYLITPCRWIISIYYGGLLWNILDFWQEIRLIHSSLFVPSLAEVDLDRAILIFSKFPSISILFYSPIPADHYYICLVDLLNISDSLRIIHWYRPSSAFCACTGVDLDIAILNLFEVPFDFNFILLYHTSGLFWYIMVDFF